MLRKQSTRVVSFWVQAQVAYKKRKYLRSKDAASQGQSQETAASVRTGRDLGAASCLSQRVVRHMAGGGLLAILWCRMVSDRRCLL